MLIIGNVGTKQEAEEITAIAKVFAIGIRARKLAQEINKKETK